MISKSFQITLQKYLCFLLHFCGICPNTTPLFWVAKDSASEIEEEEGEKEQHWKRVNNMKNKGKERMRPVKKRKIIKKKEKKGEETARGAKLPQLPVFTGGEKDKMTVIQWLDSYWVMGSIEEWSDACILKSMCKGLQGDAMEWLAQNQETVMRDLPTFKKALRKRFIQGIKAGKITEMLKIKQQSNETPETWDRGSEHWQGRPI